MASRERRRSPERPADACTLGSERYVTAMSGGDECLVTSAWLRTLVVEEWLGRWPPAPTAVQLQVRAMPEIVGRRPVKPSAQPTLVRTQHLPPAKPQVTASLRSQSALQRRTVPRTVGIAP